jgi:hypothetical protein
VKKPLKQVARLSGIGLQLTATIFVGAYSGNYLDDNYPISEKRLFTMLLTLLSIFIALYNTLKQINQSSH